MYQRHELWCGMRSEARKRALLICQVLLVFISWLFICWLHWENDGLWFGDAPYHAANGLFWKDYLLNLSFNPRDYALSYFARYPVIAPTKYPPVFYLLEAGCFGVFGPSPYIAKSLVLGFMLMAAFYNMAWCRRWVSENAGWGGVLFVFLPGVVRWSHAIMLNIPAIALSIGALYHFRKWLESPRGSIVWKHLYVGATLAVLSILTYVTSCVLLVIVVIWLIVERRWRLLWNRRTILVFVASALLLLPWIIVVVKFETNRIQMATGTDDQFVSVPLGYYFRCFLYYLKCLPSLFGMHLLFITVFGIVSGMLIRRWRRETILLLIMTVICICFFTYMPAKEGRYILLLSLPIVCLCLICLKAVVQCFSKFVGATLGWTMAINLTVLVILILGQAWLASKVHVPSVSGYEKLVEYLEKVAPEESFFYDGNFSHIFTFHVQARDPNYRRQVVLGRKLLYAESPFSKTREFISSPDEAVEVLQKRSGCKWIIVSDNGIPMTAASRHLRKALMGPKFEYVKSFPIIKIRDIGKEHRFNVRVYRFLVPIEQTDEIDMPFFSLGEGVRYRIKPIQR